MKSDGNESHPDKLNAIMLMRVGNINCCRTSSLPGKRRILSSKSPGC